MTKFALLLAILASIATSVLHVMPAQAPNAHSWMANVPSENGGIAGAKDRNTGASNALFNNPVSSPDHIVVVVEENHGYSQIIGNPDAVYINTLAKSGALFTNYHGVTHPSEGNYFALFSGSTQGVTDDGTYFFPNTPTLAGKLQQGEAASSVMPNHPRSGITVLGKALETRRTRVRPSANSPPTLASCPPCLSWSQLAGRDE